jgi:hypothetical protein
MFIWKKIPVATPPDVVAPPAQPAAPALDMRKIAIDVLTYEAERWVGAQEQGGNNQGQLVGYFQRAVDGSADGEAWCMSFVSYVVKSMRFIIGKVDHEYTIFPLFPSEHCMTVWEGTPANQRLTTPEKGCVVIWQHYDSSNRPTTNGHCGIVVDVDSKGNLITVEGNTSSGKAIDRDGQGVYRRSRAKGGVGKMKEVGFIRLFPL